MKRRTIGSERRNASTRKVRAQELKKTVERGGHMISRGEPEHGERLPYRPLTFPAELRKSPKTKRVCCGWSGSQKADGWLCSAKRLRSGHHRAADRVRWRKRLIAPTREHSLSPSPM